MAAGSPLFCLLLLATVARDQLVFVSDSPNSSAAELDTASDSDDMSQGSDGAADPGQDALAAALSSLTAAGLQIIDPEDIIYQVDASL